MSTDLTPAEVFPAGDYLRDELEERGWTVSEFAEIIGRPIQAVSEILNGKKEITIETAVAFADALGTTPDLWLNLQMSYRLFGARRPADEPASPIARRARLRNLIPLAKARSRGWVPHTNDLDVVEDAVKAMLELDTLDEQPSFALAARRSNSSDGISTAQVAWLGHIRAVARAHDVARFDRVGLDALAREAPRRTSGGPPDLPGLPALFAECGVILVFAEGLPGGKLDGAVTFLNDGRPVVGLTTRGDRFDSLLFTLLHECAHLTLQHITADGTSIVDDDVAGEQSDPAEIEANDQAARWLFPDGFGVVPTSADAIVQAASDYDVHPSVVFGRVQWETGNWGRYRKRIPKVRPELRDAGMLS